MASNERLIKRLVIFFFFFYSITCGGDLNLQSLGLEYEFYASWAMFLLAGWVESTIYKNEH